MRWVAGLLAFGLVAAAAIYFFVVSDRTFRSYAGVEVGMPIGAALKRLREEGYTVVHGPPEIRVRGCSDADDYTLVRLGKPDYAITISSDRACNVRQIERTARGIEL